jgi:excisionase family DNA binding protein
MDELLTYAQTSKAYNIKPGTLYALVAQCRIPHIRLGRRLVRFSRSALDAWFRQHVVEPCLSDRAVSVTAGS